MRLTPIALGLVVLAGCNRMLGLEEDYVLQEPLEVHFEGGGGPVILPVGTRVKQKWAKDIVSFIVSFIVVHGQTNSGELRRAGEPGGKK